MSSITVYNALNNAINKSNNTINLWMAANSSAALAGMVPVLALFDLTQASPAAAVTLTNVVLSQSPSGTSVVLTGQGTFTSVGAGGTAYPVNAVLKYLESSYALSLTFTVQGI